MNLKYAGFAATLAVGGLAVLLALATGPGPAWAMGHSEKDILYQLKPLGYSDDGGVFAYVFAGMEEAGEKKRMFVRLYFLQVEKNRFLQPKRVIARQELVGDESKQDIKALVKDLFARVLQQSEEAFSKYGIRKGEIQGQAVKITRGKRKKQNYFTYGGNKFELRLLPKSFRSKRCGRTPTQIFTLALLGTGGGGPMRVLQRDKRLYRSRGCPVDYQLHDTAYIFKSGITAFVYSFSPSDFGGTAHKVIRLHVVGGTMIGGQGSRAETGVDTWREPVTSMNFVKIPGGSFKMGCHAKAGRCRWDEKSLRTVQLDGFWIGSHEVTQGQWKKIMGKNPSRFKKSENHPVERVSWEDVEKFIGRLNQKSAAKFSLPSEAQWEFACRAGGKEVPYGTGGGKMDSRSGNITGKEDGHENTAPVGSFPPNALGLYDMSGNVWEWVRDKKTSYGNLGMKNPVNEQTGQDRVFRGGSWIFEPREQRCTNRNSNLRSHLDNDLGFRLIRIL